MDLVLYGITEVNTIDSYVTVKCAITYYWNDVRLVWNPEDYGNISKVRLTTSPEMETPYIWTPDV